MSSYSKNIFVKVWLIANVILGIASGSFFAYESHKNCGGIFTACLIVDFIFSFINLVLLGFTKLWNKYLNIANICVFITICAISFAGVHQTYKESICDNQWCIAHDVDTADLLTSFRESEDIKGLVNAFCSTSADKQEFVIQTFASFQYKILLKSEDIWYIDNSTPFVFGACQGSMCILFSLLLLADTIKQFRNKHKSSILV